jgi:hypothetical protein
MMNLLICKRSLIITKCANVSAKSAFVGDKSLQISRQEMPLCAAHIRQSPPNRSVSKGRLLHFIAYVL